jgi:hypothetical protein
MKQCKRCNTPLNTMRDLMAYWNYSEKSIKLMMDINYKQMEEVQKHL